MGKTKQKYAYDLDMQRRLRGVTIPPKIKCSRCTKTLPHSRFSESQLNHARNAIMTQGVHASYHIRCLNCNGNRLMEIECVMCRKTKGLEDFAKSQRNKPDTAKCFQCVEDQLAQNPIEEEAYEDPRKVTVPNDTSGGTYPEYWSVNSTTQSNASASVTGGDDDYDSDKEEGGISLQSAMQNLKLNNSQTNSLIDSEFTLPSYGGSYGGPVKNGNDGWTVAKPKSSRPSSSGFDPTKYGKPAPRSISFNSNKTQPSTSTQTNKGGWAKIKAYKPPPTQTDDWESEEEESSASDDTDDDDDDDVEI